MAANLPIDPNQIGALLEAVATRQDQIHYGEIVNRFNLPPLDGAWSAHPLAQIFEVLDQEDAGRNRPFRTAVVVSVESGVPGTGFFEALHRLKGVPDPRTPNARDAVWIEELRAAHAYQWEE